MQEVTATVHYNTSDTYVFDTGRFRVYANAATGPIGTTDLGIHDTWSRISEDVVPGLTLEDLIQGGVFDVFQELTYTGTEDLYLSLQGLRTREVPTKDTTQYTVNVGATTDNSFSDPTSVNFYTVDATFTIAWQEALSISFFTLSTSDGKPIRDIDVEDVTQGVLVFAEDLADLNLTLQVLGGYQEEPMNVTLSIQSEDFSTNYGQADDNASLETSGSATISTTASTSHSATKEVVFSGFELDPDFVAANRHQKFLVVISVVGTTEDHPNTASDATTHVHVYQKMADQSVTVYVPVDQVLAEDLVYPASRFMIGGAATDVEDFGASWTQVSDLGWHDYSLDGGIYVSTLPSFQRLDTAEYNLAITDLLEHTATINITLVWILGMAPRPSPSTASPMKPAESSWASEPRTLTRGCTRSRQPCCEAQGLMPTPSPSTYPTSGPCSHPP